MFVERIGTDVLRVFSPIQIELIISIRSIEPLVEGESVCEIIA